MNTFRSWSRKAWLLHGYLIVSLFLMGPVPMVRSYWTDADNDGQKEWVNDPDPGSWWEDDSDGDNLSNADEVLFGSDPYSIDEDYDGLTDQVEKEYSYILGSLDPWNWDSDGDGYSDHDEFYAATTAYALTVHYPSLGGTFYSYYDADGDGIRNQDDSNPVDMDRDGDGTVNWLDGEPGSGGVGGVWMDDPMNGSGGGGNPQDLDGDGYLNDDDSDPGDNLLHSDWNHDGDDNDLDGDEDGYADGDESHPRDALLWNDWDHDGVNNPGPPYDMDNDGWHNGNDSDPLNSALWNDWDGNGINNNEDGDEDGYPNDGDSHPRNASLWSDWNYDGDNASESDWDDDNYENGSDSDPSNPQLWSDWNHNGTNSDGDWDEDGIGDGDDSHPYDSTLWYDWNHDGDNNPGDWDEDGIPNESDADPYNPPAPPDADSDGWEDANDSHPMNSGLHSDWNGDGDNNDTDGDEDGTEDWNDSHPRDLLYWSDFDNDFRNLPDDSDPLDGSLWSDWNHDGDNKDSDGDEDGVPNEDDSHERDHDLWSDWDGNGVNNDQDGDEDGVPNEQDSHPRDASLQNDWNFDGHNDGPDIISDRDQDGFLNEVDSDPDNAALQSDWDHDGDNADASDLDGDGYPNVDDSHPLNPFLKTDWDFDGYDNVLDDLDGDGYDNDLEGWTGSDSDPRNPALHSDWNHDGDNNDEDGDEDGVPNGGDSHPRNNLLWSDWDGNDANNDEDGDEDGVPNGNDSHPREHDRWSDWNGNGTNNDDDGDEDGVLDVNDSHPHEAGHSYDWGNHGTDDVTDWDGDGYANAWAGANEFSNDSHPRNPALHSDWNDDGDNNNLDGDEDGYPDSNDSDPHDPELWADWGHTGTNNPPDDLDGDSWQNSEDSNPRDPALHSDWNHDNDDNDSDGDEDGHENINDSDPRNASLWEDWDHNGANDSYEDSGDLDRDGLTNLFESGTSHTDPNNSDTDGDGLSDRDEWYTYLTNPKKSDTDGDGLSDSDELNVYHTNPLLTLSDPNQIYPDSYIVDGGDDDGDGIPNGIERFYGLNPNDSADAAGDIDGDGTSNAEAWSMGLLLDNRDTDGDGLANGRDPFPNDRYNNADRDGDGTLDKDERPGEMDDPENGLDSDHDGLSNYEETHVRTPHTDPAKADTDGDGLSDHAEFVIYAAYGLDPTKARTNPALPYNDSAVVDQTDGDGDGIPNKVEQFYGLNPADPQDANGDLDADGITNLNAYLAGHDLRMYYNVYDSDTDGILDALEDSWNALQPGVLLKTRFDDAVADADGDGLLNYEEIQLGTSPLNVETTAGIADLDWVNAQHGLGWRRPMTNEVTGSGGARLKERDTDGDGLPDRWEHRYGAWRFPAGGLKLRVAVDVLADPDGDGLANLAEFRFDSSPLARDTRHGVTDSARLYATSVNHRPLNGLTARYRAQLQQDLTPGTAFFSRGFTESLQPSDHAAQPVIKAHISTNTEGAVNESIEDLPATISTHRGSPPYLPVEGCTCTWPSSKEVDCTLCRGTGIADGGPPTGSGTPQRVECGTCHGNLTAECGTCHGDTAFDCKDCVNGVTGTDPVTGKLIPCAFCLGKAEFPCYTCRGSGRVRCETCVGTGVVDLYSNNTTSPGGSQPCRPCLGTGINTTNEGSYMLTSGCPVHDPAPCGVCGGSKVDEDGTCAHCGGSGWEPVVTPDPGTGPLTTQSAMVTLQFPPGSESHKNNVYRVFVNGQPAGLLSRHNPEYIQAAPALDESYSISLELMDAATGAVMANDSAGPRYRKIGLNGMPLADSKPQSQDESGENPEETYIDAYTRQLRHSVSDFYAEAEGSLLPLMVRRDAQPECWSLRTGLRPEERPESAFGAGWASNVCAFIRFEKQSYPSTALQKAVVGDEMGARQTFYQQGDAWVHSKEEVLDAKTSKNVFGSDGQWGFLLTKKFGTTCRYERVSNAQDQIFPKDREFGSETSEHFSYARLVEVTDRYGNRLVYTYPSDDTMIPSKIEDPDRPGRSLSIVEQNGVVAAIKGPGGDTVTYAYEALGKDGARKLASVIHGGTTVSYGYSLGSEADPNPEPGRVANRMMHLEISSITDEMQRQYRFVRDGFEWGSTYQQATTEPAAGGYANTVVNRVQTGLPWPVKQVILPGEGDDEERTVTLTGGRSIRALLTTPYVEVTTPPWTAVTGPAGTYEYEFSEPVPELAVFSPTNLNSAGTGGNVADEDTTSTAVVLNFTRLDLTGPLGSESYRFTPAAGMALLSATDLSGNTTSFTYGDDGYDDPLTEMDALGNAYLAAGDTEAALARRKLYSYDPDTRIMTSMKDPAGMTTAYGIESRELPGGRMVRGLKVSEVVTGADATSRSTYYSYDHPTFHGLVTKQWTVSTNEEVMPSSVTKITLAAPGSGSTANPGWWNEVTQTSGTATSAGELATTLSTSTTVSDFAGKKLSVIDGRGLITNFDYDSRNRLVKVTHPDLTHKDLAYDLHGNLVKETNENRVATIHEYDKLNRRTKSTVDLNGDGDADGTYTGVTVVAGQPVYDGDIVTSTTYNARNQVVTQTDARGVVTTNSYDGRGLLTATEKGGLTTQFFYDGLTAEGVSEGYNNGGSLFDSSGIKPNRTADPRGVVTMVTYDRLYRPMSSTVAVPATVASPAFTAVTWTTYDAAGRPLEVTDPLNRVTTNMYDGLGQLIKVTEPDLTEDTLDNPTVQTFYTHHGKPWKVIDQNGAVTQTRYDALGRPVKVISPPVDGVSATATTEYDAAGNAICVTDALGRRTETVYDELNRPAQAIAPTAWDSLAGEYVRPVVTTAYDALGRPTTVTDPMGRVTKTHYDGAGRTWKVEAPDARGLAYADSAAVHATTVSTFDPGGLVLTLTNALDKTVTNTYDDLGRLASTVDAESIENSFEYDAAGNRTKVTDGLGHDTTFLYDGLNRLVRQTFASTTPGQPGDTWTHAYNEVWKTSQTSPRGIVTSYTYDARDRLLTVSAPMHAGTPELGRSYTYDSAGRLMTVTETGNAAADVSYVYDAMGRVTAESSRGQTHHYQYDLAGNRTQATYSTGRVVQTTYDGLNRPEMISEGGRVTRYGYDLAGHAVMLVGGNGQVGSNAYDALGRLVERTLYRNEEMDEDEDDASGEPVDVLARFNWEHDLLGNVLAQHERWPGAAARLAGVRSTVMGYDDNSRLLSEEVTQPDVNGATPKTTTAYTYDDANNRATKTVTRTVAGEEPVSDEDTGHWSYTYNEANQLTAWEKSSAAGEDAQKSAVLTYDAAGNRIGQEVDEDEAPVVASTTHPPAAKVGTTNYKWDAQDRLIGVTLPDGSEHRYEYDYRTRRIGATSESADATPVTKQTAIVFGGGLSVAEWESHTSTLPTAPTVEYTRGPDMGGGVGGLLYSLRDEGGTVLAEKYNLSNGRGDIVAQSDHSASLTWTASYEAYGKRTKETGTNQDKQRGNSKDEDPTGLLNEGFRYRDLETGVWLTRDPAGFVDGPNLYAYVKQNPWTGFDPEGLQTAYERYLDKAHSTPQGAKKAIQEASEMAPAVIGVTVGVAATVVAAPAIAAGAGAMGLSGSAATGATVLGSGAVGGYVGNGTANVMAGGNFNDGWERAVLYGALLNGAGRVVGNCVREFRAGYNSIPAVPPAPVKPLPAPVAPTTGAQATVAANEEKMFPQQAQLQQARAGAPPWPSDFRTTKGYSAKEIFDSTCTIDAPKIQKAIGGDLLNITPMPPAPGLGAVNLPNGERLTGWYMHQAVLKNGSVFDKITGPKGMRLDEYKKMFECSDSINFTPVGKK